MSKKLPTPAEALEECLGALTGGLDGKWSEDAEPASMARAALPAAQAQEALIRNLVLALKLAPQPPMHAAVWSFDEYIEWSETRAAVLARTKEAGFP